MVFQSHLKKLINSAFSSRYLLVTNTTIGIAALVGADFVQQVASHHVYPKSSKISETEISEAYVHDNRRSLSMAAGGLYFGLAGHHWYSFLDKKFPGKLVSSVSKKLLCEAFVGPPFVSICFYIVARIEGKSTQEWYKSFKDTIIYIIFSEWLCFLPLQAFNFYLLPPKYRYLCVAALTFFYDNFLSFIFHK